MYLHGIFIFIIIIITIPIAIIIIIIIINIIVIIVIFIIIIIVSILIELFYIPSRLQRSILLQYACHFGLPACVDHAVQQYKDWMDNSDTNK